MRNAEKNKLIRRILAVLMAIVVLFRVMPLSNADILAATAAHADGITVSVADESGEPVSGASVLYSIDSRENGKKYRAGNLTTDETGAAVILEGSLYESDDLSLSAVVSKTGYRTDGITIADAEITSKSQDFQVILKKDAEVEEASEEVQEDVSKENNQNETTLEAVKKGEDEPKAEEDIILKEKEPDKKSQVEDILLPAEEKDVLAQMIEGVSFTPYTGIYDGREHDAVVDIQGSETGDTFRYKLENGSWEQEMPRIKNAGTYNISVEVTRGAEIEELSGTASISKKDRTLSFTQFTGNSSAKEAVGLPPFTNLTYDFSAVGNEEPDVGTLTYALDASVDASDAEISGNGILTVKNPGTYTVLAALDGDVNYNDCSAEYTLTIKAKPSAAGEFISFAQTSVFYILGENSGIVSNLEASLEADVDGEITYSISDTKLGISCSSSSGKITVSDYEKLGAAIEENSGSLTVTVTAKKAEGSKYKEDETSYNVTIRFADAPASNPTDNYLISSGTLGQNNWYTSSVGITPKDSNYKISKTCNPVDFVSEAIFYDEGTADRYIYLRNTVTGAITDKIALESIKIDTVKPDSNRFTIDYSKPLTDDTFYFFNKDGVTITFTAYDVTSGVESFTWNYTRAAGASISNLETDGGTLAAVQDAKDSTKYTAQLVLPKNAAEQLKGNLSVTATDQAGLVSDTKKDDGRVIVVDSISPTQEVSYQLKTAGGTQNTVGTQHYFSDDVEFTFKIREANFFAEDVSIKISKDAAEAEEISASWNETGDLDEYEAKITLLEEGDYIVYMTYTDRSENEMTSYESEVITIDKTDPEITFAYADYAAANQPQTATITINERNFRQSEIEVITDAKDILGNEIAVDLQNYLRTCTWSSNGNAHTAVISSQFADAIYILTLNYTDLALRPAEQKVTDPFIVDHTAPDVSTMSITYSTPVMESILSAITFGFYNPSVKVTLSANDMTSGISYFSLSYQREDGISKTNLKEFTDMRLTAAADSSDKSRFTASVTLPQSQADQLRGNLAFTATDKCNNVSSKLTDSNHIIVVDTIAPTVTAEYSQESRTLNSKMYYNKAATISFTVTEANFFPEDMVVEVSKDGGEAYKVNLTWTENYTDVHVGTYTIKAPSDHSKDGDYVIKASYTDRSNNTMKAFTSKTIVIDTIDPVIKVSYSNKNVINNLKDTDGKTRKYFDAVQTAAITIDEHNFKAGDVNFTIIAKDVTGAALKASELIRKSSWSTKGDTHTMTITYSGDANYTFDIAYTDLAANKAADYAEDYFTVDKTAPINLNISYSTSLLDEIIENITFGFYNAPVQVTIDAEDATSGVYGFDYSYINAADVSSVNAELLNQAIEEAEISFSENRRRATSVFEIPNGVLGNDNQFNGGVEFTATDRSGNESEKLEDTDRIVVDNISPTATVEYNTPVQDVGGVAYYDGDITATVTVTEANFYPEDVEVSVTKDGGSYSVSPSWSDSNVDTHIGTFSMTDDGDYFVTISYADKSSNEMDVYTSDQLTLDTDIIEPEISINGGDVDGKAFKDDVSLEIKFDDINFDQYDILLTRTSYDKKNEDVTDQFITGHMNVSESGGTGVFDQFEKTAENDGIYTLKVTMSDRAGHESEKEAVFTINRFGSVYEFSDNLISLIADGGAYVKEVEDNLIITEYNPDRLVHDSLDIEISCDGKPLDDTDYDVTPEINERAETGSSGWYQYQYTIQKENFEQDGVYKISVSSADEAGNTPENTNYKDKEIFFRVDSTAPEIESIVGLESSIINATDVNVKYTVYDTIGLNSVKVFVSNKMTEEITEFPDGVNNYTGSFNLGENAAAQAVRLVVEDLAGNITDTDAKDFNSAFDFHKTVTVSTNFFVRFYANRPLFWGIIGGTAGLIVFGIGILMMIGKRRKKEEDIAEED